MVRCLAGSALRNHHGLRAIDERVLVTALPRPVMIAPHKRLNIGEPRYADSMTAVREQQAARILRKGQCGEWVRIGARERTRHNDVVEGAV